MAVITIARQYGAGAREVGRLVADRLGYRLVDREALELVAAKADVTFNQVQQVDQKAGDGFAALVSELISSSPITRHIPGISKEFDEQKYRTLLRRVITEVARQNNVVIVGRGGHLILLDHPDVVRVYLVADVDKRMDRLMARYGYDRPTAENIARREERKRLAFLKGFDNEDPEDSLLYHVVINTGLVGRDVTVDLICSLVQHLAADGG